MQDAQLSAERGHVLIELIAELGGIAHQDMPTAQLDTVVDNMLSNGVPNTISPDMQRWIHTHRGQPGLKIAQILGAHVTRASSIIPECFGRFHDPAAPECRVCLDRSLCSMKCAGRKEGEPVADTQKAYILDKTAPAQTIAFVLQGKNGQIAKALSRGQRVVLAVSDNKLSVLSTNSPNQEDTLKEGLNTMAKGKPASKPKEAVVEEEEVDLDLSPDAGEEVEEVEEIEVEVEEPAPVAVPKKGAGKPAAAVAAVAVEKPAKVAKPKPVLNKAQQDFQTNLDKLTGEDKQKYSLKVATQLKLTVVSKNDARIDHMARVMAIKAKLGTMGNPVKK